MSIAAFAGMCDGAENDLEAASADDTTMNAIDIVRIQHYSVCVCVCVCVCMCVCEHAFIILSGQ